MKTRLKLALFLIIGLTYTKASAASLDTLEVFSAAMKKSVKTIVITPQSAQASHRVPSVYVLHGYSGNPGRTIRQDIPTLVERADEYGMLIVIPDGGFDSWYLNSPKVSSIQYATFIGQELPDYVDQHYPTLSNRAHRAICGWSMGGHGALTIGIEYPKQYGAVGSMCGAVDFRPYGKAYGISKALGDKTSDWDAYTVMTQACQFSSTQQKIMIDCGTEDPFIQDNRKLHELLLQQKIAHDYTERPGDHSWHYWSKAAEYQLLYFHLFFKSSPETLGKN